MSSPPVVPEQIENIIKHVGYGEWSTCKSLGLPVKSAVTRVCTINEAAMNAGRVGVYYFCATVRGRTAICCLPRDVALAVRSREADPLRAKEDFVRSIAKD